MSVFEAGFHVVNIHTVLELSWEKRRLGAGYRPFHALSFRMEGHTDFYHDRQKLTAEKGDVLFMPRQYDYIQDATAAERIICVHFDTAEEDVFLPEVHRPINGKLFFRYFTELYRIWNEKRPGYPYAAAAVLNRILEAMVLENHQRRIGDREGALDRVLTYVNQNFSSSELSVSELAEMANVSEAYLRKLFHKTVGMSPYRYVTQLRLRCAAELLQSGYYTVEEAAARCGFANTKNFSTFIKKETGATPSQLKGGTPVGL